MPRSMPTRSGTPMIVSMMKRDVRALLISLRRVTDAWLLCDSEYREMGAARYFTRSFVSGNAHGGGVISTVVKEAHPQHLGETIRPTISRPTLGNRRNSRHHSQPSSRPRSLPEGYTSPKDDTTPQVHARLQIVENGPQSAAMPNSSALPGDSNYFSQQPRTPRRFNTYVEHVNGESMLQ